MLWATTRLGSVKIKIFKVKRKDIECTGMVEWKYGNCEVLIAEDVFKNPKYLDEILLHEFTHVIEYLNDPMWLSPELDVEKECTELAQTIQTCMSQLLRHLRQVPSKDSTP